jgi:hypothetical protein
MFRIQIFSIYVSNMRVLRAIQPSPLTIQGTNQPTDQPTKLVLSHTLSDALPNTAAMATSPSFGDFFQLDLTQLQATYQQFLDIDC